MFDLPIHVYERIPLSSAGVVMGLVLLLVHLAAVAYPGQVAGLLALACRDVRFAKALLVVDCAWAALLLWDSPSNPLMISLYDFEGIRTILLFICLAVCAWLGVWRGHSCCWRRRHLFRLPTCGKKLCGS